MSSVIILQSLVSHYRVPLFRRLHREFGWQVVCAERPPSGTYLKLESEAAFIKPFPFEISSTPRGKWTRVPLGRILEQTGARAVIAEQSLSMSSSYDLVWRRRRRGAPVTIFWSHGYNMKKGYHTWKAALNQVPRVVLSRLADANICYDQDGRRFLERHAGNRPVFVCPNTLDVAPLQALSAGLGRLAPPGRPSLLAIGRLRADRQVPRLIRIFVRFLERFPDAVLTVVGDGPDAEEVRRGALQAPEGSVRLAGPVYDEALLAEHFSRTDLVVFAGAAGLSVNHALAHGVPVMAFPRTGQGPFHGPEVSYVVDGVTGQLASSYTDDAFVRCLEDFFARHPDPRADFAESIGSFVQQNLTLDSMVGGFRQVHGWLESQGVGS